MARGVVGAGVPDGLENTPAAHGRQRARSNRRETRVFPARATSHIFGRLMNEARPAAAHQDSRRARVTVSGAPAIAGTLVAAMGALAVWLAWHSRAWPLIHDAPIMHYVAW